MYVECRTECSSVIWGTDDIGNYVCCGQKKNFITSVGLNNQETAWINGEILLVGAMADSFYFSDRNGSIREKAFQRLQR